MSDSLRPQGLQRSRPPCPSPSPGAAQIRVHWVGDAIQPPHSPSSPSPPAFNLSQHLFQWVCSSHQVAKVLELQLQHQSFKWIFRIDFLLDFSYILIVNLGTIWAWTMQVHLYAEFFNSKYYITTHRVDLVDMEPGEPWIWKVNYRVYANFWLWEELAPLVPVLFKGQLDMLLKAKSDAWCYGLNCFPQPPIHILKFYPVYFRMWLYLEIGSLKR